MKIRNRYRALAILAGTMAILPTGCKSARQMTPLEETAKPDIPAVALDLKKVAETVLGGQAEVIAQGDLARNGREQILVINRMEEAVRESDRQGAPSETLITRAAVLEKNTGKWTEVLLCDEHLKNANGYLGGSSASPATSWRLEYRRDAHLGIEMLFTPIGAESGPARLPHPDGSGSHAIAVRWNARTKRYQSLDRSHDKYLDEASVLETPESTLK